jgi:secreted Zn-dependent insulinase-like peptidase
MTNDIIDGKMGEMPYLKANEYFMKLVKYGVTNFKDMINIISNSNSHNKKNETITLKENDENSANSKKLNENNFNYIFFKNTLNSILASLNVNSLIYGYLEENDLVELKNKIVNYMSKGKKKQLQINNSTNLNTFSLIDYLHAHKTISSPVTYKIKNDLNTEHNHIVENYFQVGTRDYKISLVMNIIEMVWGNMFYYYLRTIKQLGYIVSANKQIIDNYMVKK